MSIYKSLSMTLLLVMGYCHGQAEGPAGPSTVNQNRNSIVGSTEASPEAGVSLRIHERTDKSVLIELRNSTERPIYVSYGPPPEGNVTKFLAYSLERRSRGSSDFVRYGQPFHFIPPLSPLAPQSTVLFPLVEIPIEEGEYRVAVRFYDDPDIYRLITEKMPNLSDFEQEQIDRSRKTIWSDTFSAQAQPR